MTRDAAVLAGRYAFIDAVPDGLLDALVANAHGKLRPRADAILVLRDAMLGGRLPAAPELAWPEANLRQPLLDALARSGIARHCEGNPRITDDVLASLLRATDVAQRRFDQLVAEWTLAARERDRHVRIVGLIPGDGTPGDVLIDPETWRRIQDEAARIAGQVALEALAGDQKDWAGLVRDWAKVRELLDGLCRACDIDRGRATAVLQSIDWRRSAELRTIMAGLPPLRSLVRALGRRRAPDEPGGPTALESRGGQVVRPVTVEHQVREIGSVEIRGVERSDEVSRMLASEAMLRLRPATRSLWHARRAERALLTYHAESLYTTRITTEDGFRDGVVVEHARADRGPVIIILDTSGSMRGSAEVLAKAVALQVVCVAELEGRPCYLYNFSGSGHLVEHELTFARDGLARALATLSLTFAGGTNIAEPLRRALLRLDEDRWATADLLIVTDGLLDTPEEPFDRATLRMLERARRRTSCIVHVALAEPSGPGIVFTDSDRWVVREIADHTHDLSRWIDELQPIN